MADLIGLSDEARAPLESRMTLFCHFLEERQIKPAETREKLENLAALADSLLDELSNIDPQMLMAFVNCAGGGRTPKHDALTLLDSRRSAVVSLAGWRKTAARNVPQQKPGPDGENLEWLVRQCDFVLQHFGHTIARTNYKDDKYKRFLLSIVNAAAAAGGYPPIHNGSIDRAMKKVINRRGIDSA
jgi:hypothetical protein